MAKVTKKSATTHSTAKKPASTASAPKAVALLQPAEGDTADARAAFEHFLPLASHLAAHEIVSFRSFDAALAIRNVGVGTQSVLAERARVREHLPRVNLDELRSLPTLMLAVRYAILEASRPQASASEVVARLQVAHALRSTLLAIAEGLSAAGLVPARDIKAIRAGSGALDAAADCVALADLFTRYAKAIRGKHAATAQMLNGAREVGAYLLENVKPARAKKSIGKGNGAALEARDRLHTLLVQRHAVLRKVGYYLWGDAFDAHVPALLARRAAPTKRTNGKPVVAAPPAG